MPKPGHETTKIHEKHDTFRAFRGVFGVLFDRRIIAGCQRRGPSAART
jgi:hypothetical protein